MKQSVTVCLGEQALEVGTLSYDAQGARRVVSFVYAPAWLARADRFAISPDLPLVEGHQFHRGKPVNGSEFFSGFADVEPDGWGRIVIKRDHAKQKKDGGDRRTTGILNDFDYLLWVNDFTRAGAIRLRDQKGEFQRPSGGKRDTPPVLELPQLLMSARAFEENRETARDLEYLRGNGTSLGGMRPKCSIIDDDGSLAIGKFPSVKDTRSVVHGEVLALRLAAMSGIDAAKARVIDSRGVPVAVITRFDRVGEARLMYLSAQSMLGVTPESQSNYVDIANVIRQHGNRAARDMEELWRRMVFNILINNVDDHLRNHGFLHVASDQWRLAPAFDINPFPDKERSLKTWISEDSGEEASIDEALRVANLFGLRDERAAEVLGQVRDAVCNWRNVARAVGMSAADIESFAPAFEHPWLLAGGSLSGNAPA